MKLPLQFQPGVKCLTRSAETPIMSRVPTGGRADRKAVEFAVGAPSAQRSHGSESAAFAARALVGKHPSNQKSP